MGSKRLGIVLAILAIVVTSATHLVATLSTAADVVFHLAMLVVLLVGIAMVVRAATEPRERIWTMALLVLWGITTARYVPWLGVLAIIAGCAAIALVAYPLFARSRNR